MRTVNRFKFTAVLVLCLAGCKSTSSYVENINGKTQSSATVGSHSGPPVILGDDMIKFLKSSSNFDLAKNCIVTVARKSTEPYQSPDDIFVKFYHAPCGRSDLEANFSFELLLDKSMWNGSSDKSEFYLVSNLGGGNTNEDLGAGSDNYFGAPFHSSGYQINYLCGGTLRSRDTDMAKCTLEIAPSGAFAGAMMSLTSYGKTMGWPSRGTHDAVLFVWPTSM